MANIIEKNKDIVLADLFKPGQVESFIGTSKDIRIVNSVLRKKGALVAYYQSRAFEDSINTGLALVKIRKKFILTFFYASLKHTSDNHGTKHNIPEIVPVINAFAIDADSLSKHSWELLNLKKNATVVNEEEWDLFKFELEVKP